MIIKDCAGREHDIYSVCVEADCDERMRVYFFVMGKSSGICGSVESCCIKAFCGVEELNTALDLLQELRAGLREERQAIIEKFLEAQL